MIKKIAILLFIVNIAISLFAQDFGFGFDDDKTEMTANNSYIPAVSISGEVSASILGYLKDFSDGTAHVELGDVFSGRLNFSAKTSLADGVINLKLEPSAQPITFDEAYIRACFGSFDITAGLRKLTWGKADSFGPLDVINPLDYSELTDLSDLMNFKIARPMIHLSYRMGSFSKIEGVFVPNFEPMRFAEEGRWSPAKTSALETALLAYLSALPLPPGSISGGAALPVIAPNTKTLNYAQAGLRFTTTVGSADVGAQYYYGRLTKPAVYTTFEPLPLPLPEPVLVPASINFAYNPYHQIGVDWAQVLFGFNIRAELAVNITEDLSGDDGTVYNPHLAWSFGFDRDVAWGINFNFQCNETIRLMNGKIADDPLLDIEANTDVTYTQIIAAVSKSFFRDKLEARAAIFWELEVRDFMFVPSLVWTQDAVSIELSGGFFGGEKDGQFGQYKDNNFIKTVLKYSF